MICISYVPTNSIYKIVLADQQASFSEKSRALQQKKYERKSTSHSPLLLVPYEAYDTYLITFDILGYM